MLGKYDVGYVSEEVVNIVEPILYGTCVHVHFVVEFQAVSDIS
jgi:hypothetical protein